MLLNAAYRPMYRTSARRVRKRVGAEPRTAGALLTPAASETRRPQPRPKPTEWPRRRVRRQTATFSILSYTLPFSILSYILTSSMLNRILNSDIGSSNLSTATPGFVELRHALYAVRGVPFARFLRAQLSGNCGTLIEREIRH
eukprot:SAG31_NODE_6319_length_2067_cov_1.438516_2_plen_143_part_00